MQWSHLRCPRSSCPDHGRPLAIEVGQDDYGVRGLTVEHRCISCGYAEFGPSSVESARRTSAIVRKIAAEKLRLARLSGFTRDTGVEIPLIKDTAAWPEEVDV